MMVTQAMVNAAVKQAVKDGILPKEAPMDLYLEHYESVLRMLEAAMATDEEPKKALEFTTPEEIKAAIYG